MTKAKGQRSIKKRKSKARLPKPKTTGTDYWEWRRQNPYTSYLELPDLEQIMKDGDNTEDNIGPSTPDKPSTEIKYLVIFNDFACRLSIELDRIPKAFMFGRAACVALHQMDKENWDIEEEPLASVATSALRGYDIATFMLRDLQADIDAGNSSDEEEIGVISDDDVEIDLEDEGDEVQSGEQSDDLTIRSATPNSLPATHVNLSTQSTELKGDQK